MPADAWITLAVLVVLMVVFVTDRLAPVVALGVAVVALYLAGVVDLGGAFGGFANSAPITVAALYVLAGAAELTGALGAVTPTAPAGSGSERRALARIVFPAAGASAFVPNTPLVAVVAPRVAAWARRTGRSPSRYLMPLSYAAVLGGIATLLGTSTNLVVDGLLRDADLEGLSVFTVTPVGAVVAVTGSLLLVAVSPRLLRARRAPGDDLASAREFTVELRVPVDSQLLGRTVAEAGLRNLSGVYLVEIERDGRVLTPVAPDEVLVGGDRLVFAGDVRRIVDLQALPGLAMAEEHHFGTDTGVGHRFFEAVVSETSPLNGSTLKESGFRDRYNAAVVAVHRAGTRLGGKLGDTRLRPGDVLLVVGGPGFAGRMRGRGDFLLVAPLEGTAPLRRRQARIVEVATLGLVVAAGTGLVDLTKAALGVTLVLLATRVLSPSEAKRSVQLEIVAMIAFSIGLGNAVAGSGLATEAGSALVGAFEPLGDVGILAGVLVATVVATELLSNNAAAAVMFPVAVAVAGETGIEIRPLAIGILVLASCSFLSPIGYQTNTMVFGMGGYRFLDFARLGFPLTALTFVVTLVAVPIFFPLR